MNEKKDPNVVQKTSSITTNYTENSSIEQNIELISPKSDSYEKVYRFIQDIISLYKTPKVIPLIFEWKSMNWLTFDHP